MGLPAAHETWFVDDVFPYDWDFATEGATLAVLAAVAVAAAAWVLAARRWPGIDVPAIARLAPWMPFAMRLHVGVSLIGMLGLGSFLSPAMPLEVDVAGVLLGAAMAVSAVGLIAGYHTRAAALLLIALGPIGMLDYGVEPVLARLDLLGVAAFVALAGPGRWSADHELGREAEPSRPALGWALLALRAGVGGALVLVAFTEKLAKPELAQATLDAYPVIDISRDLGLSDADFIRLAGGVELLFGLLILSGALPQLAVVAAGIPFNATLFFFGATELLGHLPIYGAMLVLLVYGSDPGLRPLVSALRPPSRHPPADSWDRQPAQVS